MVTSMTHMKQYLAGLVLAAAALGAFASSASATPFLRNAKWHATVSAPGAFVTQAFLFRAHVPVNLTWDTSCPSSGDNFVAVGIDSGQPSDLGGSAWAHPFGGTPDTLQHGTFTSRRTQPAFIIVSTDCSFQLAAYVGTSRVTATTWSVITDTTTQH